MSKIFIKKLLILTVVFSTLVGMAGCNNGPKEDEEQTSTQLGNSESVDPDDVYVDSKENEEKNKEDQGEENEVVETGYSPTFYTSINDVPENTYAIEHTDKKTGEVIYYIPYASNGGRGVYDYYGEYIEYCEPFLFGTDIRYGVYSKDPFRYAWVMNGYDETCIPTMYEGDKFIYKSSDYVVSSFALERFSDEGYTIGLVGLQESSSGNYMFVLDRSFTHPYSDTVNISNLGASEIYLVSVGGNRVDSSRVSETGFITGLTKNKNYLCDVRTGTTRKDAAFKANIRMFVSLEQYMLNKFYFSHEQYVEIPFEESMKTGYYSINGSGLFRYIADEEKEKENLLTAENYNDPFITINEYGVIISTIDGYAFNEEGCVIKVEGIDTPIDEVDY